jgi:hypothetical protein
VELMKRSDVTIMDLRGFSDINQGCIFELRALGTIGVDRPLFLLTDSTTDVTALQRVVGTDLGGVRQLQMLDGSEPVDWARLVSTLLGSVAAPSQGVVRDAQRGQG